MHKLALVLMMVVLSFPSFTVSAFQNHSKEMTWDFYVYQSPSLKAPKSAKYKAQAVYVKEVLEDGFARISTSAGDHWVYMPSNSVFMDKCFYMYDEPDLGSGSQLLYPQIVRIQEERDDGWQRIDSYAGDKWIYPNQAISNMNTNAPVFYQMNDHPTGCESYAATSALNGLGIEITPREFIAYVPQNITKRTIKNGITIWGDPNEEFVGIMSGSGFAAYPPVIVKAVNDNFSDDVTAENITGAGYDEIVDCIRSGGIVLIWYHPSGLIVRRPSSWYTPDGKKIDADFGTHTVAVTGFNTEKSTIYIRDSIDGKSKELSWRSVAYTYNGTGQKSVYINKIENILETIAYENND